MPREYILTLNQQKIIEDISNRLRGIVSPLIIRNWLDNFKPEEYDIALDILDKLRYFHLEEIIQDFNSSIERLIKRFPQVSKFYILGVGATGKSGPTLLYFFLQTPIYKKNADKFKLLAHANKLKSQGLREGSFLILIDDIIGTGESFYDFYRTQIKYQLTKENFSLQIVALCVAFMSEGRSLLKQKIDAILLYGSEFNKAFSPRSSVFGYRPKMLLVRNFAYSYGKGLFTTTDWSKNVEVDHPLGFNRSQSLIAFAHSIPNNTLPIIWSSKNNWYPLFPRQGHAKISRLHEFNSELWISYKRLINQNLFPLNAQSHLYPKMDIQILAVIKMKRLGFIVPKICQLIGVTFNYFKEIMQEGQNKGIFDANELLTIKGNQLYESGLQAITFKVFKEKTTIQNSGLNHIYMPKKFRGKT